MSNELFNDDGTVRIPVKKKPTIPVKITMAEIYRIAQQRENNGEHNNIGRKIDFAPNTFLQNHLNPDVEVIQAICTTSESESTSEVQQADGKKARDSVRVIRSNHRLYGEIQRSSKSDQEMRLIFNDNENNYTINSIQQEIFDDGLYNLVINSMITKHNVDKSLSRHPQFDGINNFYVCHNTIPNYSGQTRSQSVFLNTVRELRRTLDLLNINIPNINQILSTLRSFQATKPGILALLPENATPHQIAIRNDLTPIFNPIITSVQNEIRRGQFFTDMAMQQEYILSKDRVLYVYRLTDRPHEFLSL